MIWAGIGIGIMLTNVLHFVALWLWRVRFEKPAPLVLRDERSAFKD